MNRIIPRDLIKHLEWTPGAKPPAQKKRTRTKPKSEDEVQFKGNLSQYIQVGINGIYGKPVVISPFELEGYNDKNYYGTHHQLLSNGLYMPTPHIFMKHFTNVLNAFRWGKKMLYADGKEVPKSTVEEMYNHLTKDVKDVYGTGNPGAWTWLNAQFEKKEDGWYLGTVMSHTKSKGRTGIKKSVMKLEEFLEEDCFVDLSFNNQGLPNPDAKSKNEEYKPGKNIYFFSPTEGSVAGFDAYSDRARLNCDWDPSGRDASLGVFGCAEGAREKIKEAEA